MAHIYGQLEKAQLEMLSAEPANAPLGYVFMDTTEGVAKVKTAAGFVRLQGLTGNAKIITTDSDPSAGSGLAAPIGSLALNQTNGSAYSKTGATDTGWIQLSIPGNALLKTGDTATGPINFAGPVAHSGSVSTLGPVTHSGTVNYAGNIISDVRIVDGKGIVTAQGLIAGSLLNVRTWANTGTTTPTTDTIYEPTIGTRMIFVEVIGGGGAGGNSSIGSPSNDNRIRVAGGGGGGGYISAFVKNIRSSGLPIQMSLRVGHAGQKSTSTNATGGSGGQSRFSFSGLTLFANGGSGGAHSSTSSAVSRRIGSGGSGGTTSTDGSHSNVVVIEAIAGTTGGDTLGSADLGFEYNIYTIAVGSGGAYAKASSLPAQYVLATSDATTSSGITSGLNGLDAINFGCGGAGSGVVNLDADATGGKGAAGRVIIYEYA